MAVVERVVVAEVVDGSVWVIIWLRYCLLMVMPVVAELTSLVPALGGGGLSSRVVRYRDPGPALEPMV